MEILRYAAFTDDPAGGNPAGVVLDAEGASHAEMLAVAADVGYSESAFVTGSNGEAGSMRTGESATRSSAPNTTG